MRRFLSGVLAIFLLACASDDGWPAPDDVALRGACPLAERFGRFLVEETADYSVVQGQVSDAVVPASVPEETLASGDCRLLRRRVPFCDPACGPGFVCDFGGACLPYPEPQDLGTVRLDGLREAVAMEPVQPGFNYFATGLPYDAMIAGEPLRLTSSGGRWAAFELWGLGVESLDLASGAWTLSSGNLLPIRWDPPSPGARSEIELSLSIDQHGNSPTALECLFEDDGEAEVPAEAVDGLLAAGVTGFPSGSLRRRTADHSAVGGGCVDFLASSIRGAEVDVEGVLPCDAGHPCPDPLACDLDLEICR